MAEEFSMAVKQSYSNEEWEKREAWYVKMNQEIIMPVDGNPQDVQRYANQLERVLSIARCDYAYVKQNEYKFDLYYKTMKEAMTTKLEEEGIVKPGTKLTVDDKKSYVAAYLMTKPFESYGLPLIKLLEVTKQREIFMDAMVKALTDKKDLLISHTSAIKTEASLNNFSSSVPKN